MRNDYLAQAQQSRLKYLNENMVRVEKENKDPNQEDGEKTPKIDAIDSARESGMYMPLLHKSAWTWSIARVRCTSSLDVLLESHPARINAVLVPLACGAVRQNWTYKV